MKHFVAKALGAIALAAFAGCASVQSAYVATPVDEQGQLASGSRASSGLVISGEEHARYASKYFGLVEVTFENTSTEWVHVESMQLHFGSPERDQSVRFPEADEIDAWYQATLQRNDIRDTNAAAALDTLLFVGTVAAVAGGASGSEPVAATGAVVALGAGTAGVVGAHSARVERAGGTRPLPGSHLLEVPFAIPPGLFAKKWVLLETRPDADCHSSMLLSYEVEGGRRERVLLPFRSRSGASEWQRTACLRGTRGPATARSSARSAFK